MNDSVNDIEVDEPGLGSLVGRAVDDARSLVSAEIELYKARFSERLSAYRGAVILFAIAGTLGFCGFIALLVGLILSLATLIGPALATAAVTLIVFVMTGVLGLLGNRCLAPAKLDLEP